MPRCRVFLFSRTRRRPRSPLFPYTTLFRSDPLAVAETVGELTGEQIAIDVRQNLGAECRRAGSVQVADDLGKRTILLTVVDRKSTRLNSSHLVISYAVFCLKKKKNTGNQRD